MAMKKILLLGGSAQQVVAIETAKKLGYYTVLCDYLPDDPGRLKADRFYLVSTTDKDRVLEVAQKERIDGVLAYASDPAAPTAAYVAEKMGLPTNPYHSVDILCSKDKFRDFLKANGFNAPVAAGYSDKNIDTDLFRLPVIVKPVDSSGSKGASVLHSWDQLDQALDTAFSYSRSHRIIIEEYIEKKHPYLIGGDIFLLNGKVVVWGLLNCHRDQQVNPLVPVGKSYPLLLSEKDESAVKDTLQELMSRLDMKFGSVNVELIIDQNDRVWPIDIGPRAGGNMIPDLLSMIFGVDLVKMAVLAAMGEPIDKEIQEGKGIYATHNLHSGVDGIYQRIDFDPELERFMIRKILYRKPGDPVSYFDNASKALGIIFLKFNDMETAHSVLQRINELYTVVLEPERS